MIILDEQEVDQLTHFHRITNLFHGGCGNGGNTYSWEYIKDECEKKLAESKKKKSLTGKAEDWKKRLFRNKYGEVQYMFVPLTAKILPWNGLDINWNLITDMECFEYRMLKIQRARYKYRHGLRKKIID